MSAILKKFICGFLLLILVFSLCSCALIGQENHLHKSPEPDTSASPSPSEDSSPLISASVDPSVEPSDSNNSPEPTDPSAENSPEQSATPENSDSPAVTPPPASESDKFNLTSDSILPETEDFGQEYLDKFIFLGDSTTYGLKYYAALSGGKETKQVWTPENGTLTLSYQGFASIIYPEDGSEITIRDAVERAKPEYLVITLGVNGISFMDETYFKSEYSSLVTDIQKISPDTKIILQSIFPVASNYEYLSSINNDKISAANGWILSIAEETGTKFLNTASVLVGSDDWLPQELQNGDGLHLNGSGFEKVTSYIRTHGYQ